jgi:Flp pilus assembly protein TadD
MSAAFSARAVAAFEMGDVDGAIADLGRALILTPDDPALRYNRAFALQGSGRWDEALVDLDQAAALAPDDPEVQAAREECKRWLAVPA